MSAIPWLIPLGGLVLGFTVGHWLVIPMMSLLWLIGFFLLTFTWEVGPAADPMADFMFGVVMLPVTYVAAAVGVALRRLVGAFRPKNA